MRQSPQSDKTVLLWLVFAVVASRAASTYIFHTFDDSFITYRYAANLAEGNGLVYNIGERVQGITTPLWGVLLSVVHWLGLKVETVARLIGLVLDVTVVAIVLWYLRRSDSLVAVIALGLFAIDPYLAKTGVGGMESSLFLLLSASAVHQACQERWSSAAVLSALSYFVRPEALILSGVLLIYAVIKTRRVPIVPVLSGLAYWQWESGLNNGIMAISFRNPYAENSRLAATSIALLSLRFGYREILCNHCDLHPMDWRESPISVMFVGTEEGTLDVQTATQFFG